MSGGRGACDARVHADRDQLRPSRGDAAARAEGVGLLASRPSARAGHWEPLARASGRLQLNGLTRERAFRAARSTDRAAARLTVRRGRSYTFTSCHVDISPIDPVINARLSAPLLRARRPEFPDRFDAVRTSGGG